MLDRFSFKGLSKDLLAGLIFIGFGLAFGHASLNYDLGTALRMGPGYFPLVLAGIIILLGAIILIQSFFAEADETPIGGVPWLALLLVIGALVFFGVTVRGLGLVPSLFITSFMSASASRQTSLLGAALIAVFLTVVSMLIFIWGLGLPLRMFGPWINF
ncbi:tripartite tricarboxylate transporter TctB family protein [Mesorhizobium sp. J18]|uniref:tripartite tricarboxylate transporter TctB family protein n=1 Tax=Mesorhizobium sp. J18 TaxID=935263 RepID=UPI00119B4246|nr:tripartite tricarboxylate transporter TctB family protein [Mesorhizobium sp. J18]TWG94102.1 tripartite tricarboxylate transporter TctB family protein [Mesorhizobium sp. J18]